MSISDDILSLLTSNLANKGVLVENTDNSTTNYIGMSNRKRASIVHPFYSEAEEPSIDLDQEAQRLMADVETQIRMGGVQDE